MPSTNSRKPCTKCWRDISPSQTMSMPASSCSLIASSVASSLAGARSSPASRHCGHSLFGSASQDGFGRLPATVEGNNHQSRWLADGHRTDDFGRLPSIEPVVAAEQLFSAHRAHGEIAHQRFRAAQPIDAALAAGHLLGARGAVAAGAFIGAQRVGRIVEIFPQHVGEHRGILDRHAGALREKRQHRVGGVPDQRHRAGAAAKRRLAVVQRPFQPLVGDRDQRARLFGPGPAREMAQDFGAVAGGRPAGLLPFVVHDADDVDEAAAFDRIMHEMGVGPEPQMHQRLAEFLRHRVGRHQRAPGGAVAEARRLLALQCARAASTTRRRRRSARGRVRPPRAGRCAPAP